MRNRTKTLRWALLLSLLAAALVAAGCGGGGSGSSKDARATLDKAFKTSIKSADVGIDLEAQLSGIAQVQGPASVKITGPYQSNGKGRFPDLDWQIAASAAGQSISAGLISTGDDAWVGFQGQNYEVGKAQVAKVNQQQGQQRSLKDFGIDPQAWITNPTEKSDENVDGVDSKHITGGLDVARTLSDLNTVSQKASALRGTATTSQLTATQIAQVKNYVKNPTFDVYVGKADNKIRRLSLAIQFTVPAAQQSKVGGLKGGTITLRVDFSKVGQPQSVSAPANAKPLKDLQGALGGLAGAGSGLGG